MNTILIAESDACVRTVLRDQLHARFENARILEVDNSWDVVTFAIAAKPDMILLNEAMSRQNAYVTAARLRTMPLMSQTKLVGYSLDNGSNAPAGLRPYCDQYLDY